MSLGTGLLCVEVVQVRVNERSHRMAHVRGNEWGVPVDVGVEVQTFQGGGEGGSVGGEVWRDGCRCCILGSIESSLETHVTLTGCDTIGHIQCICFLENKGRLVKTFCSSVTK